MYMYIYMYIYIYFHKFFPLPPAMPLMTVQDGGSCDLSSRCSFFVSFGLFFGDLSCPLPLRT